MKIVIYISTVLLLFSCSKEELGPQCISCNEENTNTEYADLLIVNEGNFGNGSGAISLYKPSNKSVTQNLFFQANGTFIGNVAQSITQIDDKAYIVINNSNKIEIVDIHTFNTLATISGFNSPRYLLPINNNKAYVTDLYSNSIQIVNLTNNTISGSISLSGWTEELILVNDTVYVCDVTNDNLLIINSTTNTLIDSVKLGIQPNSIIKDQNNKLWIMCDGGINEATPKLIKFNPQARSIEATYLFPNTSESPGNLKINTTGNQLYFINSAIYRMNINDVSLPTNPFITNNGNIYYGLGIDPINEDVYVSDAIDYVQNGIIFRYSNTGALVDQFNSGIIPGEFLFIK
ncbi:MAG: YncE family protein [Flavobacteriales bacterium]|nr:YncE family protein [Flavobacteriales bacterium]